MLKIEIVWKDEGMIELEVSACNGRYSGATTVYASVDELKELAALVLGFPKSTSQVVSYEFGARDSYSFVGLLFKCVDGSGHSVLQVEMVESEIRVPRKDARGKVFLEAPFEPNAIADFSRGLARMAESWEGVVEF